MARVPLLLAAGLALASSASVSSASSPSSRSTTMWQNFKARVREPRSLDAEWEAAVTTPASSAPSPRALKSSVHRADVFLATEMADPVDPVEKKAARTIVDGLKLLRRNLRVVAAYPGALATPALHAKVNRVLGTHANAIDSSVDAVRASRADKEQQLSWSSALSRGADHLSRQTRTLGKHSRRWSKLLAARHGDAVRRALALATGNDMLGGGAVRDLHGVVERLHGGAPPAGTHGVSAKFYERSAARAPSLARVHVATIAPCSAALRPAPLGAARNATREAAGLLDAPSAVWQWLDLLDQLEDEKTTVPSVGFGASEDDAIAKMYVMSHAGGTLPDLPLGASGSLHDALPVTATPRGQMVALEWSLAPGRADLVRARHYLGPVDGESHADRAEAAYAEVSRAHAEAARALAEAWPATTEQVVASTPFAADTVDAPRFGSAKVGFKKAPGKTPLPRPAALAAGGAGSAGAARSAFAEEFFAAAAPLFELLDVDVDAARAWLAEIDGDDALAGALPQFVQIQAGADPVTGHKFITLYRHPTEFSCGVEARTPPNDARRLTSLADASEGNLCSLAFENMTASFGGWEGNGVCAQEFEDNSNSYLSSGECPSVCADLIETVLAECAGCQGLVQPSECLDDDNPDPDAIDDWTLETMNTGDLIYEIENNAPVTCKIWNYDYVPEEPLCDDCSAATSTYVESAGNWGGPCDAYGEDGQYEGYSWYRSKYLGHANGECPDSCERIIENVDCNCDYGDTTCTDYEMQCNDDEGLCDPFPASSTEYFDYESDWSERKGPDECWMYDVSVPANSACSDGACSQAWCTSTDGHEGYDCMAGTPGEACTCSQGTAKETGYVDYGCDGEESEDGEVHCYEYTCCTDGSGQGEECGDCTSPHTSNARAA